MAVCSPPRGDVLPLDASFATTSQMLSSPFPSPHSTSSVRDANSDLGSPITSVSAAAMNGRRRSSVNRPHTPSKASLPSTREVPEEAAESSGQPSMSFTIAPVQHRVRKIRTAENNQDAEARDTSDYETDDAGGGVASSRSSIVDFAPGRGPLLLNDTPRRRSSDTSSQTREAFESSYASSHFTDSDDEDVMQKLSRKRETSLHHRQSSPLGRHRPASLADTTVTVPTVDQAASSPAAPSADKPLVETPGRLEPNLAEPLDSTALRQRVEELQRKITGGQRDASRPKTAPGRDGADSASAASSSDIADLAQRVLALEVFLRKATAALPPLPTSAALAPTKSQSSARSLRKGQDSPTSRRPPVHRKRSYTHTDGSPRVSSPSSDMYSTKQGSMSSSTITAPSPHQASSCASSTYAMSTRTLSQSSFASSMYTNGTRTTHTAATSIRQGSGSDGDGEDERCPSSSDRLRSLQVPGQHVQRLSRPGSNRIPSSDSSSVSSRRVIILNGNTEIMMDEQDRLYVRWAGDFVPLVDFFSSPATPAPGRPSLPPLQPSRSLPSGASAPVSSAASVRSTHSSGSTESGTASLRSVAPSQLTHNSAPGELGHGSGSGGLHSRSLAGFSMALPTKSTAERRQAILVQEEKIRLENARKGAPAPKMKVGPGRGRMIVKAPKPPKAAK